MPMRRRMERGGTYQKQPCKSIGPGRIIAFSEQWHDLAIRDEAKASVDLIIIVDMQAPCHAYSFTLFGPRLP